MDAYDWDTMIDFVHTLLFKGFVVKLHEEFDDKTIKITMFKKKNNRVFAKERTCLPKPAVDAEGWEIEPLEFQDWWVDIIVDGFLKQVSVVRYENEEHIVWNAIEGFSQTTYYIPPSSLVKCKVKDCVNKQLSLKQITILTLRDDVGFNALSCLNYMLDAETQRTAKSSVEWWVSM